MNINIKQEIKMMKVLVCITPAKFEMGQKEGGFVYDEERVR